MWCVHLHGTSTEGRKHLERVGTCWNKTRQCCRTAIVGALLAGPSWFLDNNTWAGSIHAVVASAGVFRRHLPKLTPSFCTRGTLGIFLSHLDALRVLNHSSIVLVSSDSRKNAPTQFETSLVVDARLALPVPVSGAVDPPSRGPTALHPPHCGVQGPPTGANLLHRGSRRIITRRLKWPGTITRRNCFLTHLRGVFADSAPVARRHEADSKITRACMRLCHKITRENHTYKRLQFTGVLPSLSVGCCTHTKE